MKRRNFLALPLATTALRAVTSHELYSTLLHYLESTECIDTHEHLLTEPERLKEDANFFLLASHYINNDAISAGMAPAPPQERSWALWEPYWKYVKQTGYGECLRIAIEEVYGFAEINGATIPKINDAIAAKNKPGLYRYVLKERAKIRYAINDEYWTNEPRPVDPEFFGLARKFDWFLTPITSAGLHRLETLADMPIPNVAALKKALEKNFNLALKNGLLAVKTTMAYQRDLKFEETTEADAQRDFEELMHDKEPAGQGYRALVDRPYRRLSNHMFHHLCSLAQAHRIPFQIHTGLQAGNANVVTNSRPTNLINLFYLFPKLTFDLFHIGFPYAEETAVLAKTFPNVCADFCWMHIVSPTAARRALHEMLDMVPANKIFGFGGDYRYPELSYAHLIMARRNIATVLAERVETKICTEQEAIDLGRWLMLDNAVRVFGAQPKRA